MTAKARETNSRFRVFIVDDHPIVRRGLQLLLSMEPDMMVCGEADSGLTALQEILRLKPDVAIVDLSLKSGSGLELIKQLRAQGLQVKVIVFTMRDEAMYADRVLGAGGDGFVGKEEGTEKVPEAIRAVMQGKRFFSERLTERMVNKFMGRAPASGGAQARLSDRELEVLESIGSGLGSRQIAERLGLSLKTIESHRENIKAKLGLTRAAQLVSYAFNWHGGATTRAQ